MGPHSFSSSLFGRTTGMCASLTVGIAVIALAGWALGWQILSKWGKDYIPMAPSTALVFVILGISVFLHNRYPSDPYSRKFVLISAVFSSLMGLLVLFQSITGFDTGLEQWFSQTSAFFGRVPIGRMSPITALLFLFCGLALICLLGSRWWPAGDLVATLGIGVSAIGLVVTLRYYHETPLLYGGRIIPLALPTAIAFIMLGMGLLATAITHLRPLHIRFPLALVLGVEIMFSVVMFAVVESFMEERSISTSRSAQGAWEAWIVLAVGLLFTILVGALLLTRGHQTSKIKRSEEALRNVLEEREKLIRDLQDALGKVKTLSGLLPICSFCKRVRNDEGYWIQIESYVRDRTEADFSHGLCPECVKKHYPDV